MKKLRELWKGLEHYPRMITVLPVVLGLAAWLISGRMLFFQVGIVWFVAVISVLTAIEAVSHAGQQRRYGKRAVVSVLLQYGGYSLSAGSVAAYFAAAFWTSYRPQWLVYLMFTGLAAFFASALVPRRAKRKPSP